MPVPSSTRLVCAARKVSVTMGSRIRSSVASKTLSSLLTIVAIFISGFAESNEKIYITETCKIQVILQRTKENEYEPSTEQSTGEHKQHFPKISKIDERYPLDRPSIVSISLPLRRRHEADRASFGYLAPGARHSQRDYFSSG